MGGLTTSALEKCLSDKQMIDSVIKERLAATKQFAIRSTPTIIVNGDLYSGGLDIKQLRSVIEKKLKTPRVRKIGFYGVKTQVSNRLWSQPNYLLNQALPVLLGPNGCGKSNLVEALRWVMGETSAKQMRGGEMDDVIFGGTDKRPARNLAEVAIGLDNSDRSAPAQFNGANELEITRRIERGEGSQYRVNGTEFRARDIHTLFADIATGARSTALVSQGRIGALINAKPTQRRHILEEAAG